MLALGSATAVLGVLYALLQRDLKQLLAYSTVENVGIILVGVGLAMIFLSFDLRLLAALALTAGLPSASHAEDEVPFITTPDAVTLAMLQLAGVTANDFVIDLGSGDGRIVIPVVGECDDSWLNDARTVQVEADDEGRVVHVGKRERRAEHGAARRRHRRVEAERDVVEVHNGVLIADGREDGLGECEEQLVVGGDRRADPLQGFVREEARHPPRLHGLFR